MLRKMPVNYKKDPVAEYVNRAIDAQDGMKYQAAEAIDMLLSRMMNIQNAVGRHKVKNSKKDVELCPSDSEEMKSPAHNKSRAIETTKEKYPISQENDILTVSRTEQQRTVKLSQVPSSDSVLYFLPIDYSKRNPWRRIIGLHSSGLEIQSSTYPARSSVKKLRFAQAKKSLNYVYSYFSVEILDCDEKSSIVIGISRKDYPSKIPPGETAGSIGYCSDTGCVYLRNNIQLAGPQFSKGDVIGCGIIYPSHYKRYFDLSTDDNSDGMTDVVLTSILNKRSIDFVRSVLNLDAQEEIASESESAASNYPSQTNLEEKECDYYNENFVESRTQVEVYFTYNMQIIGKVLAHIPIGGFYPTVHIFSSSAIKMKVDLNPPSS